MKAKISEESSLINIVQYPLNNLMLFNALSKGMTQQNVLEKPAWHQCLEWIAGRANQKPTKR